MSYVLNLGASLLLQSNEIYFINNIFLLITNFSLTTGSLVHWPSLPSVIYGEYISTVQITYRSYSVIRRTVFFKKFLISTKNYRQSLGASYRRIFSETIFFYHSYWYDFKQIKGHTVLSIDFYKYGGSEKTSEVKFA